MSDLIRNHPQSTYEYCSSLSPQSGPEGQRVYYYSGVFGGPYTALNGAAKAFVQFLEQKYSFKSSGNIEKDALCHNLATEAQARGDQESSINSTRKNNKAVETGWTYSIAESAGAAPGASVPSAPPRYAYCKSASMFHSEPGGQTAIFYSAVFAVAQANPVSAWPAFLQFLQQKYSYKGQVSCSDFATEAETHMSEQKYMGNDRQGRGNVVIETGWTYSQSR